MCVCMESVGGGRNEDEEEEEEAITVYLSFSCGFLSFLKSYQAPSTVAV